jgi:hypothetical protein
VAATRPPAGWVPIAAAAEAGATGFVLLFAPGLFAHLVLGGELAPPGPALGRLAGIALLGFALACWPAPVARSARRALLTYNLLATAYLALLGLSASSHGVLLWPAVALHLIFVALLGASMRHADRSAT